MKFLLQLLLSVVFLDGARAAVAPISYCGEEPCIIPITSISCEQLIEEYIFQGSCCSMQSIPQTGGCRIEVGGAGNCFWSPACGECDPAAKCNQEYRTDTLIECKVLDFDGVAETVNQTTSCPPTQAPQVSGGGPAPAPQDTSSAVSFGILAVVGAFFFFSIQLLAW